MTVIRNATELARHNRRTDEVCRNYPTMAQEARERHAACLTRWKGMSADDRAAFNRFFGAPPMEAR